MTESIIIYLILRQLFGIKIKFMERLLVKFEVHWDRHKIMRLAELLAIAIWIGGVRYKKIE